MYANISWIAQLIQHSYTCYFLKWKHPTRRILLGTPGKPVKCSSQSRRRTVISLTHAPKRYPDSLPGFTEWRPDFSVSIIVIATPCAAAFPRAGPLSHFRRKSFSLPLSCTSRVNGILIWFSSIESLHFTVAVVGGVQYLFGLVPLKDGTQMAVAVRISLVEDLFVKESVDFPRYTHAKMVN